jgi:hypothetical protein
MDLFTPRPVFTREQEQAAHLRCPGCKKRPTGHGGGPVVEGGVLVGFYGRNPCCGFQWFREATPEQVENAKRWARG